MPQSETEKKCLAAFHYCKFSRDQKVLWHIWGAKLNSCRSCHQRPGEPCINMAKKNLVYNRWPHPDRVDWERIYRGLKLRGYIS